MTAVVIGADHAGFAMKAEFVAYLLREQYEVMDVGTHDSAPVDYPDIARAVCLPLKAGTATKGILICGSGVGAGVAANKFTGIRAAVCHDTYSARQGVEHDDMNVLCLGARVVGIELARELVSAFLSAEFSKAERHVRRLAKVRQIELEGQ